MKRAVFFDFDGTLLPQRNSLAWHFVKGLPSDDLRIEKTAAFVRAMGGLIPRAVLGLVDHELMYLEMIRAVFRGLPVPAARMAAEVVASHVEDSLFAPMRTVLEDHEDDEAHLVTANIEPILQVFCERRNLRCIATRLVVRGGVYTGEVNGVICKNHEKVRRISEHLKGDEEVHAYGNSLEDLPMLRMAHRPVLVNPDVHLTHVRDLQWAPRIFVDRPPSAFGA